MSDLILGRLDIVEKDLAALKTRVAALPTIIGEALMDHERRELDLRQKAQDELAGAIVGKLWDNLLGEDMTGGAEGLKNRRALQDFFRLISKTSPYLFTLKLGVGLVLIGAVLLSVSDLLISALKAQLGIG